MYFPTEFSLIVIFTFIYGCSGDPTRSYSAEERSHRGLASGETEDFAKDDLIDIEIEVIEDEIAAGGDGVQFKAVGQLSNGKTIDVTSKVKWASSKPEKAEFSSKKREEGLLLPFKKGPVSISLDFAGIKRTKDFAIVDPGIDQIFVDWNCEYKPREFRTCKPAEQSPLCQTPKRPAFAGDTRAFRLFAYMNDCTTKELTAVGAKFESDDRETAEFSDNVLHLKPAELRDAKSIIVRGKLGKLKTADVKIDIMPLKYEGLIFPGAAFPEKLSYCDRSTNVGAPYELVGNQGYQFRINAVFNNCKLIDVTDSVSWHASAETSRSRFASYPNGFFIVGFTIQTEVTALFGGLSASLPVTLATPCRGRSPGLFGTKYRCMQPISSINDFSKTNPMQSSIVCNHVGVLTAAKLDLESAPSAEENYFIYFETDLAVNQPGEYFFRVTSDDGFGLFLNSLTNQDKILAYDDPRAAAVTEMTSSVFMPSGTTRLFIKYFQSVGQIALKLEWKRPGQQTYEVIPTSAMSFDNENICENLPNLGQFP